VPDSHARFPLALGRCSLVAIDVALGPARIVWRSEAARSMRLTLHLPSGWPWQQAWQQLATAANSPPSTA